MQRILSATKAILSLSAVGMPQKLHIHSCNFSMFHNNNSVKQILQTYVPALNLACGMKVKGRVRRRCKSCYLVFRDERAYIMCKEHPRHKQMAMKAKPHNTWILTHASQSPVRPW